MMTDFSFSVAHETGLGVAIAGKGSVGKTTLTALLARYAVQEGEWVLAVDADSEVSPASCLGVPTDRASIVPLYHNIEYFREKTNVGPGKKRSKSHPFN